MPMLARAVKDPPSGCPQRGFFFCLGGVGPGTQRGEAELALNECSEFRTTKRFVLGSTKDSVERGVLEFYPKKREAPTTDKIVRSEPEKL